MIGSVLRVIVKAFSSASVGIALVFLGSVAYAQEQLSVEELEALLERKQAALEKSKKEREATAKKQRDVVGLLAIQNTQNEEIEEQLRILCEEHEEAKEGSLQACLDDARSTPNAAGAQSK